MEKKLMPASFQSNKSFYGKAFVRNENGETILRSYNTDVCKIDRNGNFRKLWNGYSKTTLSHVIAFCDAYNIPCNGTKKWWTGLKNDGGKSAQYIVVQSNGLFTHKTQVVFDDYDDADAYANTLCNRFWFAYVDDMA